MEAGGRRSQLENRGRTARGERERAGENQRVRKSVFVELLMGLIHYVVSYMVQRAKAG